MQAVPMRRRQYVPAVIALMLSVVAVGPTCAQITLVPGPQHPVQAAPRFIAVADFNRDHLPDVATTNSTSAKVTVLFGQDGTSFGRAIDVSVGRVLKGIAAGDLNCDGIPEISTVSFLDGRAFIVTSMGDEGFGQPGSFKVGLRPVDLAIGHFTRQRCNDVVTITEMNPTPCLNGDCAGITVREPP